MGISPVYCLERGMNIERGLCPLSLAHSPLWEEEFGGRGEGKRKMGWENTSHSPFPKGRRERVVNG
jgi:hypothetical protein